MPSAPHPRSRTALFPAHFLRTSAMAATGLMLAAGSILIATPAQAATLTTTIAGMTYSVDDADVAAGATVTDYDPAVGGLDISIPSTVNVDGRAYTVTTIGDEAFLQKALTSVVIPGTVTSIGDHGFAQNALTSVVIPDSVTSIGDNAFAVGLDTFTALTSLVIGDSVVSIGDAAFDGNALTTLVIPDSVTSIGDYAFVYSAFNGSGLSSLVIGDSVASIGAGAVPGSGLTSVVIPGAVEYIGGAAFAANPLTSVEFLGAPPTTFTADGRGWVVG